ncbi:MAG: hypothetical protein AB1447_12930 [Bacillota bacterium]
MIGGGEGPITGLGLSLVKWYLVGSASASAPYGFAGHIQLPVDGPDGFAFFEVQLSDVIFGVYPDHSPFNLSYAIVSDTNNRESTGFLVWVDTFLFAAVVHF